MKKLLLGFSILALSAAVCRADFWWDPAPPATASGSFGCGASFNDPAAEYVTLSLVVNGVYTDYVNASNGVVHISGGGTANGETWVSAVLDSSVDDYDTSIDFLINETQPPTTPGTPYVVTQTPTTLKLMWSASTDNMSVTNYEVERNGGTITTTGAAPESLLTGLEPGIPYSFRVRAKDPAGNVSDWSGTLSVTLTAIPPAITAQPTGLTVGAGSTAVFSIGATGDPLHFQWLKNGVNISGATTSSLVLANVQASDGAAYSVVVSNFAATVTSVAVNLYVTPSAPTIDAAPVGTGFYVGQPDPIVLTVAAHGTAPMTYQWRKDGVDISGATNTSYTIANPQASSAGSYTVYLTNSVGAVSTTSADLVLEAAPIRLGLQYWQPNDYPNYPVYGWTDVVVPGHWEHTAENCENPDTCTDESHFTWVEEYTEPRWQQVGTLADGQYGPTWTTTAGSFDINTQASGYKIGEAGRGFGTPTYSQTQMLYVRGWAVAPEANCGSFSMKVYNPANVLVSSGTISAGVGLLTSQYLSETGVWRVELSYSNASATSNISGRVGYFFRVGGAATANVIGFAPVADLNSGAPPFPLVASASSGLPVVFTVVSGPLDIGSGKATALAYGPIVVRASQSGGVKNGVTWSAASAVERTFTVQGVPQAITFPAIANRVFGDPPISLQATASSSLPIRYSIVGVASATGGVLAIEGAGSVSVTASQPGNNIYLPAAAVTQTFTVAKANQSISFAALPNRTLGQAPFAVTATASSGLPVKFSINAGPAVVLGNTITVTGAGTVTVTASQAGNENYNGAAAVTRQFVVAPDTTAPTAPTSLVASLVASTSVRLAWNAAQDDIGVVQYEVFRDGVSVGKVGATFAVVNGLNPQTTYQLGVRASDAAGNVSTITSLQVTTAAPTATDDGDGVPNAVEALLGTNPNSPGAADANDTLQLRIQKPNP